jgi:dTDP-4-dehydrorhamnose reductase
MKILLIGARGMLGQDLVKVLHEHEVIAWDRAEIDITDPVQVQTKIPVLQPDVIINTAAYNAVDDCEVNAELALNVNAKGPQYLAAMARALDIPFVHYSTDYVFDGSKKEGYVETDMPDPISAYGFAKRLGEKNVLETYPGAYVIRTSRLYGKPAVSENAKKSFVDIMLSLAKDRDELTVVHEEWSTPTYTPDLAAFTKELIERKYPTGIYHGVNEGACTWYEFAQEIFKQTKTDVRLIPVSMAAFPRPARRPHFSALKNTKTKQLRPWQEALAEYLKTLK